MEIVWQRMEMEIWERGVLKHQKITTPRSLHTQTTLSHCFFI